jgi:hypothetical protein
MEHERYVGPWDRELKRPCDGCASNDLEARIVHRAGGDIEIRAQFP